MAKIKFGALVVDGRGKLGGQVLSKNRAGSYMRNKVTPVNPRSPRQTVVRALFGSISQAWSALTDVQREAWNNAVADWGRTNVFGDLKNPSGKALFQRLNNQAQSAGYGAVTNLPNRLPMVEGIITQASFSIGGSTLTLTGAYSGGDARIIVMATGNVSNGTTFVTDKLRQTSAVLASSYSPTQAYTDYVTKFGAVTAGANIFVAFKYVLPSGQVSPVQVLKAIVGIV